MNSNKITNKEWERRLAEYQNMLDTEWAIKQAKILQWRNLDWQKVGQNLSIVNLMKGSIFKSLKEKKNK